MAVPDPVTSPGSPARVPAPPVAPRRPRRLPAHGTERIDDWYWLRERDDPAVMAHLEAENAYADAVLAPVAGLRDRIYDEIVTRVVQTDTTAPMPHGPWEYYGRTVDGRQYMMHCRRPRGGGDEQVLLDENVIAAGADFCAVGVFDVSPGHDRLAYAVDHTGDERFTLRVRDLGTGHDLDDVIDDVTYGSAWSDDGGTLFYLRADAARRPYQVWRHAIGTPSAGDVLVFTEPDERFFVALHRARTGRAIAIETESKTTSEVRWIPSSDPLAPVTVLRARESGVLYSAEHHWSPEHGGRFYCVTNEGGARDFKLMCLTESSDPATWTEVLPHVEGERLVSVTAFAQHLVVADRAAGLERLRVLDLAGGVERVVEVPDTVRSLAVGPNLEFDTTVLRCVWSSMATPRRDVDHDLETGGSTVVKEQPVGGGYDPSRFVTTRAWADAGDGTRVPMSIVHRADLVLDGAAPALLYGYGSYEACIEPSFRPTWASLAERGFVVAIAHVRGGGELGRAWYEDGRRLTKRHTFTDFVACAEHLVTRGYTAPGRIVARGRSAGGLLMGAVANLRPELFAAVVAEVPFVDVISTMQDASLPLTVTEWEEWGDPVDPAVYEYMATYSPYDNVAPRAYPAMLVTGGLHDVRVQYWEPAKWVQKLRSVTTSGRPIVLRTELGAGHFGPSGRYDSWRDEALVLAFACDAVGIHA